MSIRILDEQIVPFRTSLDKADTPDAREKRILAHMKRIEEAGLSGETWHEVSRENTRRAAWANRRQRKREYNAKRNAEIREAKLAAFVAENPPKPPPPLLVTIRADIEAVCDGLGVPLATVLERKKWRSAVYSRRLVVKGLLDLGYTYADISRGMGRDESWAQKLLARTPESLFESRTTTEPTSQVCQTEVEAA